MDERTEQGRRFLMGYRDDDTTEFVSDQEKKLPQPPLCKAPMGGERTVLPRDFSALPEGGGLYDLLTRRRSARISSCTSIVVTPLPHTSGALCRR